MREGVRTDEFLDAVARRLPTATIIALRSAEPSSAAEISPLEGVINAQAEAARVRDCVGRWWRRSLADVPLPSQIMLRWMSAEPGARVLRPQASARHRGWGTGSVQTRLADVHRRLQCHDARAVYQQRREGPGGRVIADIDGYRIDVTAWSGRTILELVVTGAPTIVDAALGAQLLSLHTTTRLEEL